VGCPVFFLSRYSLILYLSLVSFWHRRTRKTNNNNNKESKEKKTKDKRRKNEESRLQSIVASKAARSKYLLNVLANI